ncbi:hypothetical protein [Streptomyces antibioticus]|uniref:hypothetical protein n=1 Tax=Streptomyces antibioticus TaxID=1890 RepID=UPI0033E0073A
MPTLLSFGGCEAESFEVAGQGRSARSAPELKQMRQAPPLDGELLGMLGPAASPAAAAKNRTLTPDAAR